MFQVGSSNQSALAYPPDNFDEALHIAHMTPYCMARLGGGVPAEDQRRAAEAYLMDLRSNVQVGLPLCISILQDRLVAPGDAPTVASYLDPFQAQDNNNAAQHTLLLHTAHPALRFNWQDPGSVDVVQQRMAQVGVQNGGSHQQAHPLIAATDASVPTSTDNMRRFFAVSTMFHYLPMYLSSPMNSLCPEDQAYDAVYGFVRRLFLHEAPRRIADRVITRTFLGGSGGGGGGPRQKALLPDFALNKHAQMLVVGIQVFFPYAWSQVFEHLFELVDSAKSLSSQAVADVGRVRETMNSCPDQNVARAVVSMHEAFAVKMQLLSDSAVLYVLRVFDCVDERVVANSLAGALRSTAPGGMGNPSNSDGYGDVGGNGALVSSTGGAGVNAPGGAAATEKTKEQRQRDMAIKDSMREAVIGRLVSLWGRLTQEYYQRCCAPDGATVTQLFPLSQLSPDASNPSSPNFPFAAVPAEDSASDPAPQVLRLCLAVVQSYADWIDVEYLVTDEWVSVLHFLTTESVSRCTNPVGSQNGCTSQSQKLITLQVGIGAMEILQRLAGKKQLQGTKYTTIVSRMNVAPHCANVINSTAAAFAQQRSDGYRSGMQRGMLGEADEAWLRSVDRYLLSVVSLSTNVLRELCLISSGSSSSTVSQSNGPAPEHIQLAAQQGALSPQQVSECVGLLHGLLEPYMNLFSVLRDDFDAREVVLPFLQQYLKSNLPSHPEAISILQLLFLHAIAPEGQGTAIGVDILGALAAGAADGPLSGPNAAGSGDDEDEASGRVNCWIEQRRVVFNTIRFFFKKDGGMELVVDHVLGLARQLTGAIADVNPNNSVDASQYGVIAAAVGQRVSGCDAEAIVRYTYEIGESINISQTCRDPNSPVCQLVFGLLHSNLCFFPHSAVHLALFELYARYHILFSMHSPGNVERLLAQLLLLPCGILNPTPRTRARICYLFNHLTTLLKHPIAQHPDVTQALLVIFQDQSDEQDRLIRAQVSSGGGYGLASGGNVTPRGTHIVQPQHFLTSDEKCDLFEGIGTLLSVSDSSLSRQLVSNVLAHMQLVTSNGLPTDTAGVLLSDDICFLASLIKGFGGSDATSSAVPDSPLLGPSGGNGGLTALTLPTSSANSPNERMGNFSGGSPQSSAVARVFCEVADAVLNAAAPYVPHASTVRDRLCLFMHQLVNLVNAASSPFVRRFVELVGPEVRSAPELTRVIRVIHQHSSKTRAHSSRDVGTFLLPTVFGLVSRCVGPVGSLVVEHGIISEAIREEVEVHRALFTVVQAALASPTTAEAFYYEETCQGVLGPIIDTVLAAARLSVELELPKLAIGILARMVTLWVGVSPEEYAHRLLGKSHITAFPFDDNCGIPPVPANVMATFESMLFASLIPSLLETLTRPTVTATADEAGGGVYFEVSPAVNLADGKCYLLLSEFASLLKGVVMRTGDQGLYRLFEAITAGRGNSSGGEVVVPAPASMPGDRSLTVKLPPFMGIPQKLAHDLCHQLKSDCQQQQRPGTPQQNYLGASSSTSSSGGASPPNSNRVSSQLKRNTKVAVEEVQRQQVFVLESVLAQAGNDVRTNKRN